MAPPQIGVATKVSDTEARVTVRSLPPGPIAHLDTLVKVDADGRLEGGWVTERPLLRVGDTVAVLASDA